jgi:hypothetical protein
MTFSDSVESQPTQLLQHALTKATKIVEHSTEWGLNQQREQEEDGDNINKDFSTDSLIIPPIRGSTSQYQFHWLAPTQPQVLHREQEIVGEGEDSQKENTPASNQNIMHERIARTRSPSPQTSSAKPIKGSHADSLNPRTASGIGKAKGEPPIDLCSLCITWRRYLYFSPHVCFLFVSSLSKNCATTSSTHQIPPCSIPSTTEIYLTRLAGFLRRSSITRSCCELHCTS